MNNEVMQEYIKKMCIIVLAVIMLSASAAAIVFPVLKLFNQYPMVSWLFVGIFIAVVVISNIFGGMLIKLGLKNSEFSEKYVKTVKNYFLFVLVLCLNLIMWFFPSKECWMFSFYFLVLMAFFLDVKYTAITASLELVSLIVLFVFNPVSRPAEAYLISDWILRVICITLSLASIVAVDYLVNVFLLNAKSDQIEENNRRVSDVLAKVTGMASELGVASKKINDSSQAESTSTRELSTISENLLNRNETMLKKSEESKNNLRELTESNTDMVQKMTEMDELSKNLLGISSTNEKALGELVIVSESMEGSTQNTIQVTEQLQREVDAIGHTLDIINEIAESINLLALNASIEAARAGEAGKGFAVVAQEVGNLAASTSDSIADINNVISRVQSGTTQVTQCMNENAEQMRQQNTKMMETVNTMKEMLNVIKQSIGTIGMVEKLQNAQNEIIEKTVRVSEEISSSISKENQEFKNINQMVQSNTEDVVMLSQQIEIINDMVEQMEQLLSV